MEKTGNLKLDNPTVEAVGKMNFSGNIIPNSWFQTLRDKSGHPYMNAIVILADIRYWYTPTEVRDEKSGRTIGFKTKFKADALQRSRSKFSEQFGLSLKQVDAALDYLQACGIIKKEIRNDARFNGTKAGNTMYILLDAEMLYRYTYPEEFVYCCDEEVFPDTENGSRDDVLQNAEDSFCGERGYSPAGGEGIPPQGERISPYRELEDRFVYCCDEEVSPDTENGSRDDVLQNAEDSFCGERGYSPAGREGIPLQGERVSPHRGKGYPPTGGEGIPPQGERVSPYRGRHTNINTKNITDNNIHHHHNTHDTNNGGEEDEEYIRKIFAQLCGNINGIRMTEKSRDSLGDCIKTYPRIQSELMFLAAKFSGETCLSKVSASRIRYLTAVLDTLEERKINDADKFRRFREEYYKRGISNISQKGWDCSTEFRRDYDFRELEDRLLGNGKQAPGSGSGSN